MVTGALLACERPYEGMGVCSRRKHWENLAGNIKPTCRGKGWSPTCGHVATIEAEGEGFGYVCLKQFIFWILGPLTLEKIRLAYDTTLHVHGARTLDRTLEGALSLDIN